MNLDSTMKPVMLSFNLEEKIHDCWGIVDDLNSLLKGVLEQDLSKDQIANILLGLSGLYQLKFDETFNTFAKLHELVCRAEVLSRLDSE